MKDKTLWRDEEAKFKARNKQTAMLIRPSLEIFHPPPVPADPKPTPQELQKKRKEDSIALHERIKALAAKMEEAKRMGVLKTKEHNRKAKERKLKKFAVNGNKPTRRAKVPMAWKIPVSS